jgi:hypothetical protein
MLAIVLVTACVPASLAAPTPRPPTIFVVKTNEFWLNLHHFLYVLGESQGRPVSSLREAMRDAPADADRGLRNLSAAERQTWADAVAAYANGLSKKEPTVDESLRVLIAALSVANDAPALTGTSVDAGTREILERAAPIYRKGWWPAHRSGNQAYEAASRTLVARHGPAVLDFLTSKYALPWPAAGYAVHLTAYANWAGAYSTYGNLLVFATNPHSGKHALAGLEMMFHEGMHQWDDPIMLALRQHAQAIGKTVPDGLSHAMIFFTAGEAVRRLVPEYVPVGEAMGLWRTSPFRAALQEAWKPYLDGRGTRDEALAALVARTAGSPAGAQAPAVSPLFTFETDEFWLNLHHFLYVLGMVEAKVPDATNPAMAGAAPDAERGIRTLNRDEQAIWADAVHSYATGLSLRSNLDRAMVTVTRALADVDDAPSLSATRLDPAIMTTLERAAPIYRKVWWPSHLAANRARRAELENLLARYGASTIEYLSKIYGQPWPVVGYPVHMSGYSNFGGAYSVGGPAFLVFSSMTEQNFGLHGFEGIVHEGMHQWDPAIFGALAVQARARNVVMPRDLPHAMIFFTAGEAVRRLDPNYIPVADAEGVWKFKLSGATLPAERLKPILEDVWKQYMDGRGTRDEALAVIVQRAATVTNGQ